VSVRKSSQQAAFKLKPGKKYSNFAVHRVHCPKCAYNQEACMKVNIKGYCRQGGPYKHGFNGDEETKFRNFVKIVRNGDFKEGTLISSLVLPQSQYMIVCPLPPSCITLTFNPPTPLPVIPAASVFFRSQSCD
jgi:hypothetical protein